MSVPSRRTGYDWRAFTIYSIPVSFSPWYLMLVWVCLARAGTLVEGIVDLFAGTVSVLVHELGHAVVARRYRLRPRILLHGFGGWCEHDEAHHRDHQLRISAAGPGVGLALGITAWLVFGRITGAPAWVVQLVWDLAWMGLFWSVVNLLPILPLDGGSIAANLIERRRSILFPQRLVRAIGVVVAVLAAVGGLAMGEQLLVFLMLALAWSNASEIRWIEPLGGLPWRSKREQLARRWWWPTQTIAAVLLAATVLAVASALSVQDAGWHQLLVLRPERLTQVWRFVTYPWIPAPNTALALGAWLAVWLAGAALERRRGWRGILGLVLVASAAAGVAALGLGAPVLAGPVPLALAFVAAWAALAWTPAPGPPMARTRAVLGLGTALLLVFPARWGDRDLALAAADLTAISVGLLFTVLQEEPRRMWWRIATWWRLRSSQPFDLKELTRPNRPRGDS